MLGLLSYPILIEPRFRLAEQTRLWAYGYGCASGADDRLRRDALARATRRARCRARCKPRIQTTAGSAPPLSERLRWLALAFVPSSLMLGVTTVLTTEIPPIPMFWVLPLAIYLLSFILVFAKKPPFRIRNYRTHALANSCSHHSVHSKN